MGAGQGRDGGGGKMAKLYYHQLTEKVVSISAVLCCAVRSVGVVEKVLVLFGRHFLLLAHVVAARTR